MANLFINTPLSTICKKEVIHHKDHTRFSFLFGKYAMMITDLEPENDIHLLFDLFESNVSYPLVVIGHWESSPYSQALYDKYNTYQLLHLIEPTIPLRTLNMLRTNCYIYIDAHHDSSEHDSLLEAMYLQLPIIAYASNYNKKMTDEKAIYFKRPAELLHALKILHPYKIAENGAAMKAIIDKKIMDKTSSSYPFQCPELDSNQHTLSSAAT